MESNYSNSVQTEIPKNKTELILEKSHFAGNFGDTANETDPAKDIFMINLDSIKEYVQFLPYLPKGFGFTGGVARNALLELLGDKPAKPRDIDIEGIKEMISNPEEIEKVSKEFPPGKNRSRIIVNKDLIEYFSGRDFTINEVFLYGNHLYYSRQALEDLENKTIRLSASESDNAKDWSDVDNKLRIKALLLQIEFIKLYNQSEITTVGGKDWNIDEIPAFFLALGLERANQKENQLAFLKGLLDIKSVSKSEIPEGITERGVRKLASLIKHWLVNEGDGFEFTDDYFEKAYKEEWREDDDQKFEEKYRRSISGAVTTHGLSAEDLEIE